MTKYTSYGAGFVYKGDPEVIRSFIAEIEKICKERGIKMESRIVAEIEIPG